MHGRSHGGDGGRSSRVSVGGGWAGRWAVSHQRAAVEGVLGEGLHVDPTLRADQGPCTLLDCQAEAGGRGGSGGPRVWPQVHPGPTLYPVP